MQKEIIDKHVIKELKAYIIRLFGVELYLTPFVDTDGLPYFLHGNYDFQLAEFNSQKFLLMFDLNKSELTPGNIVKHVELASRGTKFPVVYVAMNMAAYNRDRLLKQRVPFIIPERQLYLPFLYMAITERGSKKVKEFSELGTLAQLLILGQLNGKFTEPLSILLVHKLFNYSKMSIVRAFDELEYFQFAERQGSTKQLVFTGSVKALWEKALPLLKNPCRRIVGLEKLPHILPICVAGTNALAQRTMLAESEQREYAVAVGEFNALGNIQTIPKAAAPILLQLWTYPPDIITKNEMDSFSLYLTLKNESDERIQMTLNELMNGVFKHSF